MSDRSTKRVRGFSLLEMVIAMSLGTLVLGAAVQIYSQGVAATLTTTQRAELQQDFRAASNMLTRDLSLAGAGLNPGTAIALPATATPVYGCAQATGNPCYLGANNNSSVTYPVTGGTPYLYGLLPGYNDGPTPPTAPAATDVITVVYTDNALYLNCYTATITGTTTVTFGQPTPFTTWAATGCLPSASGLSAPQAVNDASVGLTAGDLIMFTFGLTNVVAEVTTAATAGGVATFALSDALKMNQAATVSNSLASQYNSKTPVTGTGTRILVITYYLDNTVSPPRLMRQISGHTPMPVAENVAYLKFTYDLFNSTSNTPALAQCNPGSSTVTCNPSPGSVGLLPNQVTKINIQNMAMDSTLMGSQYGQGNGYQRIDLQTSVSARNLTYVNNYPQ